MTTWGNLTDNEREALSSGVRKLTKAQISERFVDRDGVIAFRAFSRADIEREVGVLDLVFPAGLLRTGEVGEVTLISPADFDYEPEITAADSEAAEPIDEEMSRFEDYFARDEVAADVAAIESEAEESGLPPVVDHRPNQSQVRQQGSRAICRQPRGTCVAHASLACLEAFDHIPDDLSEQLAHYKFNEFEHRPHNRNDGLRTTMAAPYLARPDGRICLEKDWNYIPCQEIINEMIDNGPYGPPEAAERNQMYGIDAYKVITDQGLIGDSIKNTRYLEGLLAQGYAIVFGTYVSWDPELSGDILLPVLDPDGQPLGRGGHAMLLVGYDRSSQYFMAKNSWGSGWGHGGYAYLHYNLVRSCFKYGFVVHGPATAPEEQNTLN